MRERRRLPRRRITGIGLPPGWPSRKEGGVRYQLSCGHFVPTDDKRIRFRKSRRACPECGRGAPCAAS